MKFFSTTLAVLAAAVTMAFSSCSSVNGLTPEKIERRVECYSLGGRTDNSGRKHTVHWFQLFGKPAIWFHGLQPHHGRC